VRVHEQSEFGLTQHVDEPRRNDSPGGIDAPFRRGMIEPADRGDPTRAHAHIGCKPGRTGAIDDPAMLNDEIVGGRGIRRGSHQGTSTDERKPD
jgi:hypothetical protein